MYFHRTIISNRQFVRKKSSYITHVYIFGRAALLADTSLDPPFSALGCVPWCGYGCHILPNLKVCIGTLYTKRITYMHFVHDKVLCINYFNTSDCKTVSSNLSKFEHFCLLKKYSLATETIWMHLSRFYSLKHSFYLSNFPLLNLRYYRFLICYAQRNF